MTPAEQNESPIDTLLGKTVEIDFNGTSNTFTFEEISPMLIGSDVLKRRVRGILHGNIEDARFVARLVNPRYLNIWHLLRDCTMPVIDIFISQIVPNTLRNVFLAEKDRLIFQKDLTADGSMLFGKSLLQQLKNGLRVGDLSESEQSRMRQFKTIVEIYLEEITQLANAYAKIATNNDLLLPVDDEAFELCLHPDGTWRILIIDFELAQTVAEFYGRDMSKEVYGKKIRHANQYSVNVFLQQLLAIQEYL